MTVPDLRCERTAWLKGHKVVVGVDEVGRGAWAGPVVAAAVQLPSTAICFGEPISDIHSVQLPKYLRDSKKLTPFQRQALSHDIKTIAIHTGIGVSIVEEINDLGISLANFLAMKRAWEQIETKVDFILIDGFKHPDLSDSQQLSIIKGDSLVASIAAASIMAKVYRDQLMIELGEKYPQYGFEHHKGYGTAMHQAAIQKYGLLPVHRSGFKLKFLTY